MDQDFLGTQYNTRGMSKMFSPFPILDTDWWYEQGCGSGSLKGSAIDLWFGWPSFGLNTWIWVKNRLII